MSGDATETVLVPVEGAAGECYHVPGGCGGHLVTRVDATAAALIDERDLRPCRARGCRSVGIPIPERCDGCGRSVFDPEPITGGKYCYECATHLHKRPSDQDHEQYALREPATDGGDRDDHDHDHDDVDGERYPTDSDDGRERGVTSDGDGDEDTDAGVPDSDPRHLDPAGDLADLFESGSLQDATVDDDADREELEEWLARAEAGEFGADPGVEATVRIVRALLEDDEDDGGE